MAIPGIHDVCHSDCVVIHGDKSICINGGWHDAGDLSQGLVNTSEAVYAMLALHEKTAGRNEELSERLLEEARWGLDWVLKTRFGDGYRLVWTSMHTWTDGILGTGDEANSRASNSSYETLLATAAEAAASRVLANQDPILSDYCKRVAEADWGFAMENIKYKNINLYSAAVLAAIELYRITDDNIYADAAEKHSRYILECQQSELPAWETPIKGFFYTSPDKTRIMHHEHRGHEQAPVVALVELCKYLPDHPMKMEWYESITMYTDYMKRITEYTQPYGMLPASIYDINDIPKNDPTYQDQVRNGIRLNEDHYLRLFPVWGFLRGNLGTILSQAKGLSSAAHLLNDKELLELCQRQLEWTVGRNPFNESLMYGEGYDYEPQYTFSCGDMVGSLPVGILSREEKDIPYWPSANCYVYKEVWVHPASRWLWLMEDIYLTSSSIESR